MNFQFSSKQLLDKLNDEIEGHIDAKKILISTINRSFLRYYQKYVLKLSEVNCVTNKNILLVGESGSGKTYLIDMLQKILDFPIIKLSATDLGSTSSMNSITPKHLRDMINNKAKDLYESKKYFSKEGAKAQIIVFIDEIDKLCLEHHDQSNWNKNIQQSYLKLIENKDEFEDLTFILAGAFVGLKEKEKKSNSIGFFSDIIKNDIASEITDESLIKYGMIPELVGRIQHTIFLSSLSKETYKSILYKHIIPNKNRELFNLSIDSKLEITHEEADSIIKKAISSGQGVRYLIKKIDAKVNEIEFEHVDLTKTVMQGADNA